jgi:four helix bundle protein
MPSPDDLKDRTKRFAVSVIRLVEGNSLPIAGQVIVRQLIRSAMSVRANYRSACRARSKAEFISKLHIVLEESDESLYWLELWRELRLPNQAQLEAVYAEGNELTAIFVAALKTARSRNQ